MKPGITVPPRYKSEIRAKYTPTAEYKPQVKAFIMANMGQPILNQDWVDPLGVTTASAHIKKLMEWGYVTRKRMKGQGTTKFTYTWHDKPLSKKQARLENGEVYITESNKPKVEPESETSHPKTDYSGVMAIDRLFIKWCETVVRPEDIMAVVDFRKFCKKEHVAYQDARSER